MRSPAYLVADKWVYLVGTGLLCLFLYLLCYAAVLIKFTYYAQNYAQEKELCLVYYQYLYAKFHEQVTAYSRQCFYYCI